MWYRILADGVVLAHLAFIVYVALGGFLAWRWRRMIYPHIAAMAWSVGIITVGYDCPLTHLEKHLRQRASGDAYEGGFIDRYVEDVIYPDELTSLFRALVAFAILFSYAGWLHRRRATLSNGRTLHPH